MSGSVRVLYSGRVQGVGFRYRTRQIARDFAIHGYVKNLRDGRVELRAEGEEAEIKRFLETIRDSMAENISSVESTREESSGLSGFEVLF